MFEELHLQTLHMFCCDVSKVKTFSFVSTKYKSSIYPDCVFFFFSFQSNALNSYLLLHTDFLFHLFEINGCAATMWLSCLVYTSFTGRRVLVQQGGGQLGLL